MEFEKKWMSNEQEMSGFIQERNKRTPLFFTFVGFKSCQYLSHSETFFEKHIQ